MIQYSKNLKKARDKEKLINWLKQGVGNQQYGRDAVPIRAKKQKLKFISANKLPSKEKDDREYHQKCAGSGPLFFMKKRNGRGTADFEGRKL